MASWVLLAIASLLVGLVRATPSISFPINSQVPPVARIGQPFSFVFSEATFTSSSSITYTLAQSPDWISLDGEARRIYGTPQSSDVAAGDVVGVPVGITATDDTGSVTTTATLVVTRNPPPTLSIPLSAQTPTFAPFSQPSSIITHPDTSFAFTLASNTFTGASVYYAVMADNSPLPSWMTFDAEKLSFSGQTPALAALVQPPQSFDFQLVASDVPGFSGASLPFSMVVGNHAVTSGESFISLNATVGQNMSYTGLAGSVKMDNQDARSAGVTITSSGLPSWLELNTDTWEISGTPPATATSSNFTISFEDKYSDTLNLTLSVSVSDGLFVGNLPALNVTAGKNFTFDLGKYLASSEDLEVSVTSSADWVKYDATTQVISGEVPSSLGGSQIGISIDAKSKSTGLQGTEQLKVSVLQQTLPTTLLTASPKTTSSEPLIYTGLSTSIPSTATAQSGSGQGVSKSTTKTILLAVLIPVLLLALTLLGIVAFCIHRRRKRPSSINRRDISRPVAGSLTHSGSGSGSGPEMAESLGTIDSYDSMDDELRPASYLARDMQGPYFTDASLLTPPPSRGGLHPSSGDAWPSSNAWPPSSAWRRSSNPYSPPKRPDIDGNRSAPNLRHADTPTRAAQKGHTRSRTSRYSRSKILDVDIPDSNIFSGDSTPDSASFFANTNFASSPPLIGGTITPSASTASDSGTRLEDFMHGETIRRVPTDSLPSNSSSTSSLAPPPLARLRTPAADTPAPPPRAVQHTVHPRRLFAEALAPSDPPTIRSPSPPVRGGPLSSSPWTAGAAASPYTYDSLGLPRPTPRNYSYSTPRPAVRVESSVYSDNNTQVTPSMSPSRWPHPPSSRERPGGHLVNLSVSEDDGEEGGLERGDLAQVSAEDVNEWIGVATSRYSKASSWLEAAAGFEGRGSQEDVGRDGSSQRAASRPATAGRSSGDYPVFI